MGWGVLLSLFNILIPDGKSRLYVPDLKFNRRIGDYAGQLYSVTGELLSAADYETHRQEVLPSQADLAVLNALFKEGAWVETKKATTQAE